MVAAVPLPVSRSSVLFQPYDLLRWTPTGKAWKWYRRRCTARVFRDDSAGGPPEPKQFVLLYDDPDAPAAESLRQDLAKVGWTQVAPSADAASVLLADESHYH